MSAGGCGGHTPPAYVSQGGYGGYPSGVDGVCLRGDTSTPLLGLGRWCRVGTTTTDRASRITNVMIQEVYTVVGVAGLEPTTSRVFTLGLYHLSYTPSKDDEHNILI